MTVTDAGLSWTETSVRVPITVMPSSQIVPSWAKAGDHARDAADIIKLSAIRRASGRDEDCPGSESRDLALLSVVGPCFVCVMVVPFP